MANRVEKRREQRRGGSSGGDSSSRLAWVLGGAAFIALAIVGWNVFSSITDDTARTIVDVEYDGPEELIELAEGVSMGNPDAPVTVMEFGDYQCPSCQAFFRQAKPILDVSYVQPGQVQFVYYDFPLEAAHPNAVLAARAARCAGEQDAYWEYHDQLFLNQPSWAMQADPVGDFVGYGDDLGLDSNAFRSCVRSDRYADVVSANQRLGLQLGVQSTPTVLVDAGDGRAIRVANWSTDLRSILDDALARAEGSADGADDTPEEGLGEDAGADADTTPAAGAEVEAPEDDAQ